MTVVSEVPQACASSVMVELATASGSSMTRWATRASAGGRDGNRERTRTTVLSEALPPSAAGTGAGAAVIDDGALVRRADGYGWLVGDEGSGVWIGTEAVRAALRAYDGRGAPTTLAESVPRLLLGEAAAPLLAELDLKTLTVGTGDTAGAAMSSGAA